MPKTVYLPDDREHRAEGAHITWTPSAQRLVFGGWYDRIVGLPRTTMTLREFFDMMGITERDIRKAMKEGKSHD